MLPRTEPAALRGARVFVTGGLGFLGSNLAHRLVELGAEVHLYDALVPGHGGLRSNVDEIAERVRLTVADLRDRAALEGALDAIGGPPELVFDLAGQNSHWDSIVDPASDLAHNCTARLALLEALRRRAPRSRVVFASTRQVYGRPIRVPVDESHPLRPVDLNGIHKIAAEEQYRLYGELHGLDAVVLRLTNTLGPRMRIRDARQTFVGLWIRRALEGRPFEVWGGDQLRDFNDVDDAVDALLVAATSSQASGRVYNLGAAPPISLRALAELLGEISGASFEVVPFPEERRAIEIGDYHASFERIERELGWRPNTPLRSTLERTLAWFAPRLAAAVAEDPHEASLDSPSASDARA